MNNITFNITAFAFVCSHSKGSVITDFVVQTTEVDPVQMAQANEKLKNAMLSIAPVIGSVSATYNSKLKKKVLYFLFDLTEFLTD